MILFRISDLGFGIYNFDDFCQSCIMTLYCYRKAHLVLKNPKKSANWKIFFTHSLPNILIILGSTLLTTVGYPLFSHQVTAQKWAGNILVTPVSEIAVAEARGLINPLVSDSVVNEAPQVLPVQTGPEIIEIDYTKLSNWFPKNPSSKNQSKEGEYYLSIPELKIKDAKVIIGGDDLDKSLIHYTGTSLPGEYGNTVIFGHSVLPAFYNPKDYHAIFSTLPTLEKGDEILINYDGLEFKYKVEEYKEVKPDDIEMLEQRFDRRTLSLVTCVPPGTYLRRGVIRANLISY